MFGWRGFDMHRLERSTHGSSSTLAEWTGLAVDGAGANAVHCPRRSDCRA